MAYKIHIKGNKFLIDNLEDPFTRFEGLAKDVLSRTLTPTSTAFGFTNVNQWSETKTIEFADIDLTGAPYTDLATFNEWLEDSLGKSSDGTTSLKTGGFIDYNDTSTTTTPIVITADTWIEIPNDGLGAFTNKNYKPEGVTELMLTPSGYIDASELVLGDSLLIRNDYSIVPNTNNSLLKFRYSLGTGAGSYTLEKTVGRLDSGSGASYRRSLVTDLIYMGDSNTKDNPIKLEINLSTTGILINAGTVIQVIKY